MISINHEEELLATDDLLVHYFNEFLSLPVSRAAADISDYHITVFYVALTFNKNTKVFEELTDAAESLTLRIRATLREYKSKLLSDRAESPFSPMCDNTYTVLCLDREQGAEWIKRERLLLFLQSDYYFEYRLAKLLSQVDSTCLDGKLEVDPTYSPWAVTTEDRPAPAPGQCEHKPLPQDPVKYSRDWSTSARQTQASSLSTQSSPHFPCSDSEGSLPTLSPRTAGSSSQLSTPQPEHQHPPSPGGKCSGMEEPQSPHEFYLTNTRLPGPLHGISTPLTSPSTTVEHFSDSLVKQVIRDAILEMEEDSQCANEGTGSKSPALRQQTVAQRAQSVQPHPEHAQRGEEPEESEPESDTEEPDTDLCGIQGNKNGLKDFKSFLRGTPGEKLFNLWMDIQRLQSLQNSNSKNRHLMRMRSWYMLSSGQSALSAEVLSRLGLASTPCWREAKLCHVQPRLIEALLLYWCPRFLRAERAGEESVSASLRLQQERQLRPPSGIDPNPRTITLLPLRPSSCFPRIAPTNSLQSLAVVPASPGHMGSKRASLRPHTQGGVKASLQPAWGAPFSAPTMHWAPMNRAQSKSRRPSLKDDPNSLCMDRGTAPSPGWLEADGSCSPFLGGRRMEQMLQSLQSEPKSGFYFTHFCEGSQNQLWESGIHFWTDLQEYHQLFYQDGLDPYRLQQQAQLLYSTYLCPGARMSIGLDEESRRQVYMCLTPPFEELFDSAEEHVLALLLQPWTMLMDRDRAVYERVDLWEETHHVGTAHYRKLQALHRKLLRRLNQNAPVHSPPPPPEVPSEPDLWLQVPEQFRSYHLGSLLRHRLELQQFHSFLEENFASMDLLCWLDLEQYKRLPQKDRAQREERCRDIRSRYLSRRYFFGPNSPASREEQEEVIGQAGGWGRILQGGSQPEC
ncbi:hypothetical protein AGOR_G00113300 [Albula goreensis]|uniref:RGS domain-containing protein n=1 Tax=Albula goreensis TaxID=1534307 RepID=A0A8T3DDH2_9TELE|nr:hypothetical protein AGOR_G00113300 [Albula goreensis]